MPPLRSSGFDHGWHDDAPLQVVPDDVVLAAHLIATYSDGSSHSSSRTQLGITYETAWLLAQKLRRSIIDPRREPQEGLVEIDQAAIHFRPDTSFFHALQ